MAWRLSCNQRHTGSKEATDTDADDANDDDQCGQYSESEDEVETAGVTRSVLLWGGNDVAHWVASLPPPCNAYSSAFRDQVPASSC